MVAQAVIKPFYTTALLEWKKTKEELTVRGRVNAELKEWSEAKYAKNTTTSTTHSLVVKGYKDKPTSEERKRT
jgi:hypothetical protein